MRQCCFSLPAVDEREFYGIKVSCDGVYLALSDEPGNKSENTDTLKKICELADGADRRAKMMSRSAAYDAGQHTFYAVTPYYKLVTVCSDEDSIITSNDENFLEIQGLCSEKEIY